MAERTMYTAGIAKDAEREDDLKHLIMEECPSRSVSVKSRASEGKVEFKFGLGNILSFVGNLKHVEILQT